MAHDLNQDGFLDRNEIYKMLKHISDRRREHWDEKQGWKRTETMLAMADKGPYGKINHE